MKKIFTTLSLSIALCASVNAESSMRILTLGLGIPGIDEPQLMGLSISPNGQYVCGSIDYGAGYFLADIENNIFSYATTDDDEGAELRHVDNNGLAIGFNGPGVTYSIEDIETVLQVPSDDYRYVLGEDISNDGSVMVGSLVAKAFETNAAYCADGGEWTLLPQGTAEQIGDFAEEGSAAKYVSGDGKVILGYVGSFGPAVMWIMNDEGKYEFDPLFTRYVILTEEEEAAGEKQLYNMSAVALSNNGKYAAFQAVIMEDEDFKCIPAVYDIENKELKVYSEPQEIDMMGIGMTPTAIADDGTMIGIIGTQPMFTCMGSFLWKAGEDQAVSYTEEFPEYAETFGFADSIGYMVPTGMSADGRYLQGYGFYAEDFFDDESIAYYATYVIDTKSGTSSIEVIEGPALNATPEAIYSIDGKRMERMSKGLNIVRMSDGTAHKVMNK